MKANLCFTQKEAFDLFYIIFELSAIGQPPKGGRLLQKIFNATVLFMKRRNMTVADKKPESVTVMWMYALPRGNAKRRGDTAGHIQKQTVKIGRKYITAQSVRSERFHIQPVKDTNGAVCYQQAEDNDWLLFMSEVGAERHRQRDLLLAQVLRSDLTGIVHNMAVEELQSLLNVIDGYKKKEGEKV